MYVHCKMSKSILIEFAISSTEPDHFMTVDRSIQNYNCSNNWNHKFHDSISHEIYDSNVYYAVLLN